MDTRTILRLLHVLCVLALATAGRPAALALAKSCDPSCMRAEVLRRGSPVRPVVPISRSGEIGWGEDQPSGLPAGEELIVRVFFVDETGRRVDPPPVPAYREPNGYSVFFWRSPFELRELIGREDRIFGTIADPTQRPLMVNVSPTDESSLSWVGTIRFPAPGLWLAQVRPLPTSQQAGQWATDPIAIRILPSGPPSVQVPAGQGDPSPADGTQLGSSFSKRGSEMLRILVDRLVGLWRGATATPG